ncbi:oxidoreductase-like domain-containing protein [Chitinimonas koreensis]|uniref:oxidoreductase-like domain-containing protein n=1 Tax=Chitinimonas koreensis TaxID=356302 RepID=UPI0004040A6F|nr:oxidoreductase-like domain-containing protein [Chitinimonas koreensis]QNM95786.1 oxidoreductase [Chitinimonas koreensis]
MQHDPTHDPKPLPPIEPEPEACCNSGCSPCIFDFYAEELQLYRRQLLEWERRQQERAGEGGTK